MLSFLDLTLPSKFFTNRSELLKKKKKKEVNTKEVNTKEKKEVNTRILANSDQESRYNRTKSYWTMLGFFAFPQKTSPWLPLCEHNMLSPLLSGGTSIKI